MEATGDNITINSIHIYPVKSCQGISVSSCDLTSTGLGLDRRWAVASTQENPLHICNQYENHKALAEICTSLEGSFLCLSHHSTDTPLRISLKDKDLQRERVEIGPVQRSHSSSLAESEGPHASEWLTKVLAVSPGFLGVTFYLLRLPATATRDLTTDPRYGALYNPAKTSTSVAFADSAQIHLVSTASATALSVASTRPFRPNIVISGCEAYDEDSWQEITVGGLTQKLRVCMPALRCRVVDNTQGCDYEHPKKSILASLVKTRKCKLRRGCAFGIKLNLALPVVSGTIKVGDEVIVSRRSRTSILEPETVFEMRKWADGGGAGVAVKWWCILAVAFVVVAVLVKLGGAQVQPSILP